LTAGNLFGFLQILDDTYRTGSHFLKTLLNLSINMGITIPIAFIRSLRFCAALCFNIVLFCVASFINTVFSLAFDRVGGAQVIEYNANMID
jgi:hypothetical protein